jgi:hypothetical protein
MLNDIPDDWDDEASNDDSPEVDFEVDPVVIHEETEDEELDEDSDEETPDPDVDNAVVEFVDLVNARDMDGLVELLAPDVECVFLGETSQAGVIDGLSDLIFRHPDLVVTRGDLGPTPVVATWLLDADADHYRFSGMFTFELSDDGEGTISRLDYVEEIPDEDLVVEVPEDCERPEWEDWSAQDET